MSPKGCGISPVYGGISILPMPRRLSETSQGVKVWKAINLLTELIFPTADALQLVNRMESDLGRLKVKLTEGTR